MTDAAWLWTAKATGAVAGSAISLAYMLPRGRREAASDGTFSGYASLFGKADLGRDVVEMRAAGSISRTRS